MMAMRRRFWLTLGRTGARASVSTRGECSRGPPAVRGSDLCYATDPSGTTKGTGRKLPARSMGKEMDCMAKQSQERPGKVDHEPLAVYPAGSAIRDTPPGDVLAVRVVRILAGILMVLLSFRFVLALLGANPYNGFVHTIYAATWPLVAPFYGMFGYPSTYPPRFELYTLFAMAVYALVAWGLMAVVRIRRAEDP